MLESLAFGMILHRFLTSCGVVADGDDTDGLATATIMLAIGIRMAISDPELARRWARVIEGDEENEIAVRDGGALLLKITRDAIAENLI